MAFALLIHLIFTSFIIIKSETF